MVQGNIKPGIHGRQMDCRPVMRLRVRGGVKTDVKKSLKSEQPAVNPERAVKALHE